MRQSAAVLCRDNSSLQTLRPALQELGIEPTSQLQQLHQDILNENCSLDGFPWLHRVPVVQNTRPGIEATLLLRATPWK